MAFPAFWIFQNFQGEDPRTPPPLIKGIHKNLSSTATAAEDKKKKTAGKLSPIKTIYKKFIFRLYRN